MLFILISLETYLTIESSSFRNNLVDGEGGALYLSSSKNVDILASSFVNNIAMLTAGGDIHFTDSDDSLYLKDIVIDNPKSLLSIVVIKA